ncbi:hypothetical protein GCM10018966_023150 [Streptomyces yanii]
MRGTDLNVIERPYDGRGKCLLGVRRLSRVKLATSSPERQRENVLTAAASVGAHIIGWADDWEVSGATDPVTRPKIGPWLRDEKKMLVTYGHNGAWDLDDPADENRFTMEAWGAQMELRAIQRRNRDATIRAPAEANWPCLRRGRTAAMLRSGRPRAGPGSRRGRCGPGAGRPGARPPLPAGRRGRPATCW